VLLRFRFSNFRSFRDEQELSLMAATSLRRAEGYSVYVPKLKKSVLTAAAIYGANASGKTSVFRALLFFTRAVVGSHREWKPDQLIDYEPFAGQRGGRLSPALYEIDFLIDGVRYCYGFRISATAVEEEWLLAYPRGKKQTWFARRQGQPMSFSNKLSGPNRVIEGLTRKDSLFLSAAAQNNHEALMPIYRWVVDLRFVTDAMAGPSMYSAFTASLCVDQRFGNVVADLVRAADLGIESMKVEPVKFSDDDQKTLTAIAAALNLKNAPFDPPTSHRIRLVHRIGKQSIMFDADSESKGTLAYLRVLGPVVKALALGVPLLIDELEASLHPLLASELVRMFNDKSTNPKGAQLIFNTHDVTLLDSARLRRDQIWFTEKREDGSSQLYPLTDFKPRPTENLHSGYLQGRYGAIPFVSSKNLLAKLGHSNGKA
jgi:hypothetical protein